MMEIELQAIQSRGLPSSSLITLSLCGDVMTGRGIDQILPHPCDPTLCELSAKDAKSYVELAERANGPIPKPVDDAYVWGDALEEWDRVSPDVRIINLETSVTTSSDYWRGKEVRYRMNPQNTPCLAAAQFDCCSLANNHVLDWGEVGLVETIKSLKAESLKYAGAGRDRREAAAPVVLAIPGKGRVVVFAFGSVRSGVPYAWAAKEDRPGVNLLVDMSDEDVHRIRQDVARVKHDGDIVVASIHWGVNWGYGIPESHRTFAHHLIDVAGIDLIHGHSSHHVLGIEVYRNHLILHGCGDFLNDYEGISGFEEFRGDLGLIYFADIDPQTGELCHLGMTPTQVRRMRVQRAGATDIEWLRGMLNRESQKYGVHCELAHDRLTLHWDKTR